MKLIFSYKNQLILAVFLSFGINIYANEESSSIEEVIIYTLHIVGSVRCV